MSIFTPKLPRKEIKESHHPWDKTIKGLYSNTYKYGHNSANNPVYPVKKEEFAEDRIKFTVIGNRVTKEFIFCYYLVKLLHKYRRKQFEAPVIQGVTGVEWPKVWNDLKHKFGGTAYCISSQVAVLIGDKFLGGQKELKKFIGSKYIYHLCIDYYKEGIQQFANYINSTGRPFAYMQFSINGKEIGNMIFMLYADIVPRTCENFLNLCDTNKGGYSGTPVHRIVKDCWIQCGGYGLKDNPSLDCENFIVSHDRRGVLCMANDGRNNDCSTQFFVLLQSAPWMAHKYVAFGQLIEGESTLSKIESVPTWYESPTADIRIYKSGIFDMNCHWVPINKHTHEYIHGHVENLFEVGEAIYEDLLQKVFLEIQIKQLQELEEVEAEYKKVIEGVGEVKGEGVKDVTKRLISKKIGEEKSQKEDPEPQLNKIQVTPITASITSAENKDFDVDVYEYETEGSSYSYRSILNETPVKPEKPYYIPYTDVPYPGEVDSIFNLQKLLQGDYCFESDIVKEPAKRRIQRDKKHRLSIPETLLCELFECFEDEDDSDESLDTDEENDIRAYIKENGDSTSFAGRVIKKIANLAQKYAIFDEVNKNLPMTNLISDDELRIIRMAEKEQKSMKKKQVSISLTASRVSQTKIQRRATGYIRKEDLAAFQRKHDEILEEESELDDSDTRKVRIATDSTTSELPRSATRADMTSAAARQSVLARLYVDVKLDEYDDQPTLKDFKPSSEQKSFMWLTQSDPNNLLDDSREKMLDRQVIPLDSLKSIGHILSLQHGKTFSRKISNDYTRTIKRIEQKPGMSIRSFEFAKKRPSMSVLQYKQINQKYQEELRAASLSKEKPLQSSSVRVGLRLPGDSPLYFDSMEDVHRQSHT